MITTMTRPVCRLFPVVIALCLAATLTEGRSAFAGYADVWQTGDTLYIAGDGTPNTVVIVGAADTVGKVAVYIHKDPWIYQNVTNIEVDLAGDADTLKVAQLLIAGDLTITTGGGDDVVLIGGWQDYGDNEIAGNVSIDTSNGLDAVLVKNTSVLGSLDVLTGGEPDMVHVSRSLLQTANIQTGGGDDTVIVGEPDFSGSDPWDGPTRDPRITDLKSNEPTSRTPTNDRKAVTESTSAFVGGPSVVVDELFINTGSGADDITLHFLQVEIETVIEMEDGSDELLIAWPNEINGSFNAHGGSNEDYAYIEATNDFESTPSFHSFEAVIED